MTRHQTTHYFQLPATDLPALERIISLAGFKNKTAYFTACAKATVYGSAAADTLDPVTLRWIDRIRDHAGRRETLMHTLMEIIRTLAYPVLAMKGEAVTLRTLKDDLRSACYQETGRIATDQDIKDAVRIFADVHKDELEVYRTAQLAERYFPAGV